MPPPRPSSQYSPRAACCKIRARPGLDLLGPRRTSRTSPRPHLTRPGSTVWRTGKAFVWDDSFEHEAVYVPPEGATDAPDRYVLYMSLWHPEMLVEARGSEPKQEL